MELLKLVIVDDEPILLQGLLCTYDWKSMGFEVVGTAQSGEQALEVIRDKQPQVVLTDIRMKKITGLMVMEQIQKEDFDCLFVVLSAYRDFEYAKQACDLGAYAYLLKPIEDEKLQETMCGAYKQCMEQRKNEAKYESWENLLMKDTTSFLQVVVQKYIQNRMPVEKVKEVFDTLQGVVGEKDRFIATCVDIDLTCKITNSLDYEASRLKLTESLSQQFGQRYFYWKVENEEGRILFIIRTKENNTVKEIRQILERVKKEEKNPVVAAISKPYMGMEGIKRSSQEAEDLFHVASVAGASALTGQEEKDVGEPNDGEKTHTAEGQTLIVNAVRRNNAQELKEAFVHVIYSLPEEDAQQNRYLHEVMLKAELMLKDTYGMTDDLAQQFQNYYSNMKKLSAAKAVDVCYKILGSAIEARKEQAAGDTNGYFKSYLSDAVAYIAEHLDDENLSIVSVAEHIYLNPVYFGRVFKNHFKMTFKKYLLQQRMEMAKQLMEDPAVSIGTICERVGIGNPSYFSHLFKQYTGKLPSEYKKDYEA